MLLLLLLLLESDYLTMGDFVLSVAFKASLRKTSMKKAVFGRRNVKPRRFISLLAPVH